MKHRRVLPIAVVIVWGIAEVSFVFGSEITWEAQSPASDMNTGSNWSSGSVPGSTDDAVFDSTVSGVATNPTENTTTFSVLTLKFPSSASLFNLNFENQTLTLNAGGITGAQTNTTINAANTNNESTLSYQIAFSGVSGSAATSGSAALNITNTATLSDATSGVNIGWVTDNQLYSSLPFSVGTGGSISVTSQGSDETTGTGNSVISENTQVAFGSDLHLDGNNTVTILNSSDNSGVKTGGIEVGTISNDQFSVGGNFSAGNNINITTTNSANDSSTGSEGNYVGALSFGDQFYINGTTNLGAQSSITLSNSGTYTGSSTSSSGSNIASRNAEQIVFNGAFIALDALTLDVSNTGTSSATVVGNDNVGTLSGTQVSFNASASMGNDASITIYQQGQCSALNSTNGVAVGTTTGGGQLSVTGAFSAGENFYLNMENSGIRTGVSESYGGDFVGRCQFQGSLGNSCALGNNATINISNSGQNSSNTGGALEVAYVEAGSQMQVQEAFTAMDNLTMTISNSAQDDSLMGSNNYIGSIIASQLGFTNTFTSQENTSLQITNSGTSSSSNGGNNQVGTLTDQVLFGSDFSVGNGFLLNITNTGVDKGASTEGNNVANVGDSQLTFTTSCTALDDMAITISNNGTNSGSTPQNSVSWINNNQFYHTDALNVQDHFSLSVTNTGLDSDTGYGGNMVGYINNGSQIGSNDTFTVGNNATITVSNIGTNSGSVTTNGNSVAYVQNFQAHFSGGVSAGNDFQLSVTNSGEDRGSSPTQDLVGVIFSSTQVQPENSFAVGDNATITCTNSGVNSSNNPGALVGYLGDSQFYINGSYPFTADDDLNLTVTNSGNDSSTGSGGNNIGALGGNTSGVQLGCDTFQAGDHAVLTLINEGMSSGSASSGDNNVGFVLNQQLYISGASFQVGNDFNMNISNSGADSSTGTGGNNVGYIQNDSQVNYAGVCQMGDNATIAITNRGTNSGSATASNHVGFVSNYQLDLQGAMTAGNNFTLSVENSGINSNTGVGGHNVGVISNEYQMQCLSTLRVGDNATITVANSGTNTSDTTGNTVGNVSRSQFAVVDAFQSGENLKLSVTNTAVNSGNTDNTVGSVGSSQIVFNGTCKVGDGSMITAFNSGTVYGTQMQFSQGVDITSGSITLQASNQGTLGVTAYGIQIDEGSGGDINIILANDSLYIDSPASGFMIGALNGDSTSFVQSSPTLTINTDASVSATFAGDIQDYPSITSSLIKTGSGAQALSGINTYTGLTSIEEGVLSIAGSVVGDVAVSSGGTLKGAGTIGGTAVIENGATIAPGNSIGTIKLGGLVLNPGSITAIEIDPTASSSIHVTGAATLSGNVQVVPDAGLYGAHSQYLILDASSISGSFAPTIFGGLRGYNFNLNQTGNHIYLLCSIQLLSTMGLSGNALTIANYLNDYASVTTLLLLNTLSENNLSQAINSISPSRNAFGTYITEQVGFSLSNLLTTHIDKDKVAREESSKQSFVASLLVDASDRVAKNKEADSKFSGWISGFGEFAHQKAQSQNPSFNFISEAVIAGFDYHAGKKGLAGGALGYAHTHFYDEGSLGHGNINYYFASVYGNVSIDHFYISPAIWGVFNQNSNTRKISFPGFSETAKAHIFAWQMIPHLEVGYEFKYSWGGFRPFTAADWAISWQRAYTEKGASPFNASQKANNSSMVRSETGVKFCEKWQKKWGTFFFKEKISYVFEKPFGVGTVNTAFSGIPTAFTVNAVDHNLNLAVLGLDFLAAFGKKESWLVDFSYNGEIGVSYWSNDLTLSLTKHF